MAQQGTMPDHHRANIEVRGGRLRGYSGNYSKFVEERSERRRVSQAAAAKEKAKAAKLAQFVAKNSARASTAAAARSRAKQLEGVNARLEEMREDGDLDDKALGAGPGDAKRVTLRLPPAPDGAKEVLTLTNATIGYGGGLAPLIKDVDLVVTRGDRLLIVGPNGAGKSTLLRSLGGSLRLQRYAVVPLSNDSGLLEWVQKSRTLQELVADHRRRFAIALDAERRALYQARARASARERARARARPVSLRLQHEPARLHSA